MKLKTLVLNIFRTDDGINISAFERNELDGPIRSCESHSVNWKRVDEKYNELVNFLDEINYLDGTACNELERFEKYGQFFYDEILPLKVKEKLNVYKPEYLILEIDEMLGYIPWELFFDGNDFFSLSFGMGRIIRTENDFLKQSYVLPSLPLRMLILFDPNGDLSREVWISGETFSGNEAELICSGMEDNDDLIDIDIKCGKIDTSYVRDNLRDFDFVHYGGHAEYDFDNPEDSGWVLTDGMFKAADIKKMAGGRGRIPSLIFSNACRSGLIEKKDLNKEYTVRSYGFAKALLLAGVKHYIGTFWDIPNAGSAYFALEFYRELSGKIPVGDALKNARHNYIKRFGKNNNVWSNYILYGDPTHNYFDTHHNVGTPRPKHAGETGAYPDEAKNKPQESREGGGTVRHTPPSVNTWLRDFKKISFLALLVLCIFLYKNKDPERVADSLEKQKEGDFSRKLALSKLIGERIGGLEKNAPAKTLTSFSSNSPVSIAFCQLEKKGRTLLGRGEDELVVDKIINALIGFDKISIVERSYLLKILDELKLSTSALADPESIVRVGKITSCRLMVFGSVYWYKNDRLRVTLRMVDTQNTSLIYLFTKEVEVENLSGIADEVATEIKAKVREFYTNSEGN